MTESIIGIDLGGTFLKAALVGENRDVLAKFSRPSEEEKGPEHVINVIERAVHDIAKEGGSSIDNVAAVGICMPGMTDWKSGFVYSLTNMTGWKDIALGDILKKRFDGTPCFLENDGTAACYGEQWLGAGRGTESMCMLTLGTGVGGGMVVNGQLHRGIDGTAAEIGHMIVRRDGRECGCGARGCLEAYASVSGLVRTAIEGIEAGRETILTQHCDGELERITGRMISECADEGDAFSNEAIVETGEWLGVGIAGLIALLNPECVALAGGMIKAGDRLMNAVNASVQRHGLDVPTKRAKIVYSELGEDAGVIGAAGCALSRL